MAAVLPWTALQREAEDIVHQTAAKMARTRSTGVFKRLQTALAAVM